MAKEKSIAAVHVTPLAALDPESNLPTLEGHSCEVCKKPIKRTRKWHRFCSSSCQKRAWRKKGIPISGITTEAKHCQVCGQPFKPIQKHQRFCSGRCRTRACRKQAIPTFENLTEAEDYVVRLIRAMNRHAKTSRQ